MRGAIRPAPRAKQPVLSPGMCAPPRRLLRTFNSLRRSLGSLAPLVLPLRTRIVYAFGNDACRRHPVARHP